jgi:hypothetical protein
MVGLRELVVRDAALRQRLLAHRDRAGFAKAVVEIASEAGLTISPEEVDEAVIAAWRRWQERWV